MLSQLLKTSERVKILESVLMKDEVSVTQISQETGVSKGLVSRYLNYMKDQDLLGKDRQTYLISNNGITRALKILFNLENLKWDEICPGWVKSAGLYGSWASGTNKEQSDVDIWVKVESYPEEDELNLLYKKIKSTTASEVNLLILTSKKLDRIKESDLPFYHSLQRNTFLLAGEPL